MSEQLRSILIGTIGLDAVLVAALVAALRAPPAAPLGAASWCAILAQGLHFAEEYASGFHLRFPALFGLAPWPERFFVGFNATCLAVFVFAALAGPRVYPARAALWALAIASVMNAVAHPTVAVAVAGYFPGVVTAPLVGAAGGLLAARLWRRRPGVAAQDPSDRTSGPPDSPSGSRQGPGPQ